jgi:recombination protein RecA
MLEIFGPPDCGKTVLGLEAIAAAQRAGGAGAILDAEHTLDARWAATVGVRTEDLLYATPTGTAEALAMVIALVKSCAVDLIVLDSVAALGQDVPDRRSGSSGIENSDLDVWPFVHGMRTLHHLVRRSPCCVIFVNQTRAKLSAEYGSQERTPGQPALPNFASLRVRMERRARLFVAGQAAGSRVWLQVVKSPFWATPREASLEIHASSGISREADLLMLGSRAGLIARDRDGLWMDSDWLGANTEQARGTLLGDWQRYRTLSDALRERAGLAPLPVVALEGTCGAAAGA